VSGRLTPSIFIWEGPPREGEGKEGGGKKRGPVSSKVCLERNACESLQKSISKFNGTGATRGTREGDQTAEAKTESGGRRSQSCEAFPKKLPVKIKIPSKEGT